MNKLKKQTRGITLVALVVTIIVLLILAAVSLAMLTGENGIITKAKLSKSKTEEGGVREEVELAIQEIVLEKRHKEELTTRKIGEYLEEKLYGITVVETTDDKIKIEYKGYEIEITSNWKVKIIGKAGITVTYTTEPTGYAKDSIEIILNIQTREGVSVTSVVPEDTGVEVIETNKKFRVTENKIYKFKLTDNSSNERTIQVPIDNIDQEVPKAQIEWITKTGITNSTIKAKVTIEDEKSGVDLNNCKWVLEDSVTPVGKDIASYTGGTITSEDGEVETGTVTEAKKYYMHVLVTDKVGNTEEYCSKEIEVKSGYIISTPQQFQNMKNDLAGNYYVVNDIDMKDFNFTTIPGSFSGTLDGQGHTISNLKISSDSAYVGVFRKLKGDDVSISNILFKNVDISSKKYAVGVLAVEIDHYAKPSTVTIQKVGTTGKIKRFWQYVRFSW